MNKENLLKSFSEFLDNFGGTKEESPPTIEVAKSLNEDKRLATFVVLSPDEVDLQGDVYSSEEVEKACYDYNRNCMKANLAHLITVDDDTAFVLESYITPVDMQLDDQIIKSGTWLQTWKINDDSVWEGVKNGYWTGLSIQCTAETEEITDES